MEALLSRRAMIATGLGLTGALRLMPSTPACVLTPEQEEGPYYVDDEKIRQKITEGKLGVPLQLKIALVGAKNCSPLANASVDIWHCDAEGIYSGFTANNPTGRFGPGGPPPGPPPGGFDGPPPGPPPDGFGPARNRVIDPTRFLRGVQVADNSGLVEFRTIYPGWYEGRAIHIHMKVHVNRHVAHTGQLFFPEEITADIASLQPYIRHKEVHRTTQTEDHVFQDQHGASGMMTLDRVEPGRNTGGFIAKVTIAVDPEATPGPVRMGGPPFSR